MKPRVVRRGGYPGGWALQSALGPLVRSCGPGLRMQDFGELWIGRGLLGFMGFCFFQGRRVCGVGGRERRSVGPLGAFLFAKEWQALREPVTPSMAG